MPQDLLKDLVGIGSIASALVTLITALASRLYPWARTKQDSRAAKKRLGSTFSDLEESIRYYIVPQCDVVDPSSEAGVTQDHLVQSRNRNLFRILDRALAHPESNRYLLLLADSGMGKTSALINYFARHIRRWRKVFDIAIVPLGTHDAEEKIGKLGSKENTVLFLDAFDEDQEAVRSYRDRIDHIISITLDFRCVLISCRTQFFPSEAEVPSSTKRKKVGPRPAGEPAEYLFRKIYISPFSEQHVRRYIRRRYPFWKFRKRRSMLTLVRRVPNLAHRPMLLAHLDSLAKAKRPLYCSVDIYEELVEAWLQRERGFVPDTGALREFSELAAVDMFVNSGNRRMEKIPRSEIEVLAKEWGIHLDAWILTTRSLLNRDDEGNYKFSHRSILEYLCLCRMAKGDERCLGMDWTDQMLAFFGEVIEFRRPWLIDLISVLVRHEDGVAILGKISNRMAAFCRDKPHWILRVGRLCCLMAKYSDLRVSEISVLNVDVDFDGIRLSRGFWANLDQQSRGYVEKLLEAEDIKISSGGLFALAGLTGGGIEGEIYSRFVPDLAGTFSVAPKEKFRPGPADQGRFPSAIIVFGLEDPEGASSLNRKMAQIWQGAGNESERLRFRRL